MSTAYLASIEVFVGVSLLVAAWVFRRAESRLGYLAVAALASLFPAVGVPLGVGLLFSRGRSSPPSWWGFWRWGWGV